MNKVCPLCQGKKTIPASNGATDEQDEQPCNVCAAVGEVDEQRKPDSPIIIYKPWGTFAG